MSDEQRTIERLRLERDYARFLADQWLEDSRSVVNDWQEEGSRMREDEHWREFWDELRTGAGQEPMPDERQNPEGG